MDEHHRQEDSGLGHEESLAVRIRAQRTHLEEFLAAHRDRVGRVEASLTEQLGHADQLFTQRDAETRRRQAGVDERTKVLDEQFERLRKQQEEHAASQEEFEEDRAQLAAETNSAQESNAADRDELKRREAELVSAYEQFEADRHQFEEHRVAARADIEQALADLNNQRTEVDDLRQQVEAERRDAKSATEAVQADHEKREQDFREREEALTRHESETGERIAAEQSSWEDRQREFAQGEEKLQQDRAELDELATRTEAGANELAAQVTKLEEDQRRLDEARAQLEKANSETDEQRIRIANKFKAHRKRQLKEIARRRDELESIAEHDTQQLEESLNEAREERDRLRDELDVLQERLGAETTRLESQLDQQAAALQVADGRRAEVETQLAAAHEKAEQLQATINERAELESTAEHDTQQLEESLNEAREERDRLRDELDVLQERLGAETTRLESQLDQQAAAQQVADGRRAEVEVQLAAAHEKAEQLQATINELAEAGNQAEETLAQLREERDGLQAQRDAATQQMKSETDRQGEICSQLRSELQALASSDNAPAEVRELQAACDELRQRLAEAESQVAEAAPPADSEALADLDRRYEMALEDLREAKQRNEELGRKLASGGSSDGVADGAASRGLDWEAQKQMLLAELEAESGGGEVEISGERQQERMTIQATIEKTEAVVARKNSELDELRGLLAEQSEQIGAVAVGAAALGEMVDNDEVIQQEREALRQVQEEWREKLRQAEIDLSVERAKTARDRLELEELVQAFEREKAQLGDRASSQEPSKKSGSPRRWLSRLGLADDE